MSAAAGVAGTNLAWSLFPRFVLRRAGFAWDRLEPLAAAELQPALDALHHAETRLQAAVDDWNARLLPAALAAWRQRRGAAAKAALERVNRAVRRRLPPVGTDAHEARALVPALGDWLDAFEHRLADTQAAERHYRLMFDTAMQRCRQSLAALAAGDDFRQAVLLLGGPAPQDATQEPRNSTVRQQERLLFKYAQRFCAKNETNSVFGPVHHGDVHAMAAAALALPHDWPQRRTRRAVFFSPWAIDDLVAAMAADPLLAGPLQAQGGAACLQPAPHEVDAAQGLADRVAALKTESVEEAAAVARWRDALAALLADAQRVATATNAQHKAAGMAAMESRFQALGGGPVRRHAGRMFRSRGLVYEDACVDAPAQLSEAAAQALETALSPVLDVALLYTRLVRAQATARCRAVARAWFGGAARVPFDRFLAAWHRQQQRPQPVDAQLQAEADALQRRVQAFDALWTQLLDDAPDGRITQWRFAEMAALCHGLPVERAALVSPDVLPWLQPGGGLRWVLGEIHHGVTFDGWMLAFAPDQADCKRRIDDRVAQITRSAGAGRCFLPANLVMARRMKTAPALYPGPSVGLSAPAPARPPFDSDLPQHALRVQDLLLQLDDPEGLRLVDPTQPLPLRLHPPAFGFDADGYAPFEACSLPLLRLPRRGGEGALPRCMSGDVAIARAEWRLPPQDLPAAAGDEAQALRDCDRWRRTQGMPRQVFLKTSNEPKPFCIDWLSPHAVELLQHLRRQGGRWSFSEMLPGPDGLWMRMHGARFTSECRFLMTGVAP